MSALKKPGTYADLAALPEHLIGELIDEELIVSPRPRSRHAHATSNLASELINPFGRGRGGPGGWWIVIEPELHLGSPERADVLVPDLAGWRTAEMPVVPDVAFFTLRPSWVCEVLSPSTAQNDLVRKLPKYARAGIAHAWLIDPVLKTVEAFRRESEAWLLVAAYSGDEAIRAEPFEAVEIELGALWLPGPVERTD